MGFAIDMTGQKFGLLTVLAKTGVDKGGNAIWFCYCECGSYHSVIRINLRNGNVTSCGCRARALSSERLANQSLKHGHAASRSPTYVTWEAMRQRCNNSNSDWYHRYGGRGIVICERWNDFRLFVEDMGFRPAGKTLDRINPDGNYEPDNCKWATPLEQSNNKSKQ